MFYFVLQRLSSSWLNWCCYVLGDASWGSGCLHSCANEQSLFALWILFFTIKILLFTIKIFFFSPSISSLRSSFSPSPLSFFHHYHSHRGLCKMSTIYVVICADLHNRPFPCFYLSLKFNFVKSLFMELSLKSDASKYFN